jgi:RIO kinase 1
VVIIDVSQSVEREHPRALEFLRMDCQNITDYFRRSHGVPVMTPRELFDFTVHAGLGSVEAERAYIEAALDRAVARTLPGADDGTADGEEGGELTGTGVTGGAGAGGAGGKLHESAEAEVEHAVFMQSYIPQSLSEVRDAESETARVLAGTASDIYHTVITGVGAAGKAAGGTASGGAKVAAPASAARISEPPGSRIAPPSSDSESGSGSEGDDDDEGSDEDDDGSEGEGEEGEGGQRRLRVRAPEYTSKGQSKEEKKAHKAAVKEAQREKRKTKIPKHVKKKHAKAAK